MTPIIVPTRRVAYDTPLETPSTGKSRVQFDNLLVEITAFITENFLKLKKGGNLMGFNVVLKNMPKM